MRNCTQQRTRIRGHVVNTGNAAHDFGVFKLGNTAGSPLDDLFQLVIRSPLGEIVRIRAALAVEVSHQKFVLSIGAKISRADRVNTSATTALHVRSIFQDGYLVILGFDGKIETGFLKQGTGPGSGSRNHDRRGYFTLAGADPPHASSLDAKRRLGLRQIRDSEVASTAEEIVGHTGAVAVPGIRFVGGKIDFVHRPIGLQFLELGAIDKPYVDAELVLHFHILFQPLTFTGMNNSDKASLAEISFAANHVTPVLEHPQADERELNFGGIAIVHTNQRGRAPASALTNVALVDDHDLACLSRRQVKCNGRAHYAGAENHDVRGGCPGAGPGFGIPS